MSIRKGILSSALVVGLSLIVFAGVSWAATYNATTEFSTTNGNPNGVWSYGWMPTDFTSFNSYVNHGTNIWYGWSGDYTPGIWLNTSGQTSYGVPAGWLSLHPGNGTQPSSLRFTAPSDGQYEIDGTFLPGDSGVCLVGVRKGSEWLWQSSNEGSFDLSESLTKNETIDFMVYGAYGYGNTPLELTISTNAVPVPAAVILLGSGLLGLAGTRFGGWRKQA